MSDLLVTSGYNFEGYSIVEYFGVFSGECALGTGFLSSLGAGFADFFGSNSSMYSGKLRDAKEFALKQLYDSVRRAGGNAIIGLDIDYTTFSADIMGVIANGTAVKIIKQECEANISEKIIPISRTNLVRPFRCASLPIAANTSDVMISLDVLVVEECQINGLIADISITTVFEEEYTSRDIHFINFKEAASKHHIQSSPAKCDLPSFAFECVKSARIMVKKYINQDNIIEISANMQEINETITEEKSNQISFDEILYIAESLESAKEIQNYFNDHPEIELDPILQNDINDIAFLERSYGNMKDSVIKKMRNALGKD
ncbi:MAG: YbjQ family protein [Lachnospiraceae bacterium]|nr:YbjQ family protein [Lachnospiraceae bacterium]